MDMSCILRSQLENSDCIAETRTATVQKCNLAQQSSVYSISFEHLNKSKKVDMWLVGCLTHGPQRGRKSLCRSNRTGVNVRSEHE